MERIKRITDNHVLYCQSSLIDHLLSRGLLFEDMVYMDNEDILEWWLVTYWLAEQLKEQGEVIIDDYGCYWWGRQCSGQAINMDAVIAEIAHSFD